MVPGCVDPFVLVPGTRATHLCALLGLSGTIRAGADRFCQETPSADTALPAVLGLELGAFPTDDLQDKGDL
jgi:hypothetical protein